MAEASIYEKADAIDWSATVDKADLQEQRDEILALQSMYEGSDEERICVLTEPDENGKGLFEIELKMPVQLATKSCQVDIWMPTSASEEAMGTNKKEGVNSGTENGEEEEGAMALTPPPNINRAVTFERSLSGQRWTGSFRVKYLTPFTLHVTFPPCYPSEDPPAFTLSCLWLSGTQLSALCRKLDELWEGNQAMPVVYTWIDWLENQALECLGITDTIVLVPSGADYSGDSSGVDDVDSRAIPECWDVGQAIHTMIQYSNNKEAVEFCKSTQECCLCFDEKPGTHFFRLLPCKHHFCFDCLSAHCQLHVNDGTIQMLKCPGYECKSSIMPDVLQALLSPELFARWERLCLQRTLDEMDDIVYCPRCRSVVIREREAALNLGHCLTCYFSFCTQCEQPWHQGTACQSDMERLEAVAKNLSKDARAIERYRELKRLAEEKAQAQFLINNNTVPCPKCKVPIEKIAGCNKMTCRCGQSFCWLCKKAITGYDHFQGPKAECSLLENVRRVLAPVKPPPDAVLWMRAQMEVLPDAKERVMRCPMCKQDNMKAQNNNHLHCWNCKSHMCFVCKARIMGVITRHFMAGGCPQHS